MVLLPHTGKQQATNAAERLQVAIAKGHLRLASGLPLQFTASFGVTTTSGQSKDIDELLIQADAYLSLCFKTHRQHYCELLNNKSPGHIE